MEQQIELTAELKTLEISRFVLRNDNVFETYPEVKNEYWLCPETTEIGSNFINHIIMIKENYQIISQRKTIGTFSIIIPLKIKLKISLKVHLYIKNNLTDDIKQKIIASYKNYDYSTDINDYIISEIKRLNLNYGDFTFATTFTLEKIDENGQPTHTEEYDTEIRNRILNSFNQNDGYSYLVTIFDNNGVPLKKGEYLQHKRITVNLIPAPLIGDNREYEIVLDYTDEKDSSDYEGSENDYENLKKDLFKSIDADCAEINFTEEIELVEIKNWPEYRVVWIWKDVIIGRCKSRMFLAVAQRKISNKILVAFVTEGKKYLDYMQNQIKSCAEKAALNAAVIGIVESNIGEAINTFRALFTDCVEYHFHDSLDCLSAGLFLKTNLVEDWREFI